MSVKSCLSYKCLLEVKCPISPFIVQLDYFRLAGDTAAIPKKASNLRMRSAVDTAFAISRN